MFLDRKFSDCYDFKGLTMLGRVYCYLFEVQMRSEISPK